MWLCWTRAEGFAAARLVIEIKNKSHPLTPHVKHDLGFIFVGKNIADAYHECVGFEARPETVRRISDLFESSGPMLGTEHGLRDAHSNDSVKLVLGSRLFFKMVGA